MDLDGHRDDVVWRPAAFHRCLAALPVIFPTS
ncbi:cytochrome P450 [Streptomyces sp. NRRL B-3648]|nr:cytochrome P450 [Streptomyces sp. NRRL B-3648]